MALRDRFDKIISYFDTDEVSDVEETVDQEAAVSRQPQRQQPSARPRPQQQPARDQRPPVRPQSQPVRGSNDAAVRQINTGQQSEPQDTGEFKTTIVLKYPHKYEDAQEIVDLLISKECILVDFQYMLDAQARRCIDFIDGARRVVEGNLQKVGSSMFLLTPSNVEVDVDALNFAHNGQDSNSNFDFDMKRR
ncbi:cell division protein SepF [Streptococcus chenjunshii]|uniref:Cell division protein SepF n=1 Tax=Streptococcus chenjunshii TaxID=2173853 RepID=A0A372KMB3_9STRE|nr:cell division protein SepF [Streptococcus chenjunshii]AXQ78213.1 cell division protein SepF [Streptococcus chenjunshii]RFU50916.1 cell division protein SepF [Streptococcus chenjunshii]RFU53413.1 cell division protein SepF [Streptococcus chenjunshii]